MWVHCLITCRKRSDLLYSRPKLLEIMGWKKIDYSPLKGSAALYSLVEAPNHVTSTVNRITPRVLVDVFSVPEDLRQALRNLRR